MKNTPLSDIMIPNPITLNLDDSFCDAAKIFSEKNIRHLPVVNAAGEIMGIISQRDFNRITAPKKNPNGEYVYNMDELAAYILKQNIIESVTALFPEDPLEKAVELMAEKKLGCIPIVDHENKVVGIVSAIDILKLFLKVLRQ
ncbi:MAG: CBS domain-containing protein [Candidatus Omnitrophica bacterium]|nr:CBS domain-containing protein [Candidatus Omnitrophota bacterium]